MNTSVIMPSPIHPGRIGLGCVTFGREIGEDAAMRLLDHAQARGVTMLDTAAAYAQGASERIIGRWKASRKPVAGLLTIATKLLPPFDSRLLDAAVAGIMERLDTPVIDLLYLHRWDSSAEKLSTLAALEDLVRSGKVRALGVSNYNLQQLKTALELQRRHGWTRFSVLQNNHNLAVSDLSPALLDYCAANGIAVVTYSPLGAGFLTGKHRRGVEPGSRFEVVPGHQDVYFRDNVWSRLARLEAVAARSGQAPAHLALAWALHEPGVACVLVGGRTPAHLDQAFAALSFDDTALLSELTELTGRGVNPTARMQPSLP